MYFLINLCRADTRDEIMSISLKSAGTLAINIRKLT